MRASSDALRPGSLHIPLYKVFSNPDFFGGEEDRVPRADRIRNGDLP